MKTFRQLRKTINEKFVDIDSLRHVQVEEKPVDNYRGDYKDLRISEVVKTQVARLDKN